MDQRRQNLIREQSSVYEIQVRGVISQHWLAYMGDLQMEVEGESSWATTTLTGTMIDQAELHGLLQKLYSLGLTILKVELLKDRQKEK